MYSTRLVHLLMVALSVTSVTGVAWLNPHQDSHEVKRQDDPLSILTDLGPASTTDAQPTSSTEEDPASTSDSPPDSTTSADDPPSSTTDDQPTPSTTSTEGGNTSPTPTNTSPTSPNGPTSASPTSPGGSPTPTSTRSTGTGGGNPTSDPPSSTAPPVTSTIVTRVTTTDAAGQTFVTSASSTLVTTPTPAPDNSDSQDGMDQGTKNTIIGVCVGVGGAIVLAAAGVLFWRLRSRRRSQEESEELVSYGDGFSGPGAAEKSEPAGSASGRSPFQSTLESYHAPTQTNAASNF
ncbi:hypothetical protein GGR52DRAFT_424629 [Hypoxylon sp. FL1284]|nr:hypothetical protein GGR52DRAFT_424629 [Hypoxylon sp. FL1284]